MTRYDDHAPEPSTRGRIEQVRRRNAEAAGDPALRTTLLELASRRSTSPSGASVEPCATIGPAALDRLIAASGLLTEALRLVDDSGCTVVTAKLAAVITDIDRTIARVR